MFDTLLQSRVYRLVGAQQKGLADFLQPGLRSAPTKLWQSPH